jgi:hypothetical protein
MASIARVCPRLVFGAIASAVRRISSAPRLYQEASTASCVTSSEIRGACGGFLPAITLAKPCDDFPFSGSGVNPYRDEAPEALSGKIKRLWHSPIITRRRAP